MRRLLPGLFGPALLCCGVAVAQQKEPRAAHGVPHLVAIPSGPHSPPVIQSLGFIHEHPLLVLSPWAAATGVVQHERVPGYTFRLSPSDFHLALFNPRGVLVPAQP